MGSCTVPNTGTSIFLRKCAGPRGTYKGFLHGSIHRTISSQWAMCRFLCGTYNVFLHGSIHRNINVSRTCVGSCAEPTMGSCTVPYTETSHCRN